MSDLIDIAREAFGVAAGGPCPFYWRGVDRHELMDAAIEYALCAAEGSYSARCWGLVA